MAPRQNVDISSQERRRPRSESVSSLDSTRNEADIVSLAPSTRSRTDSISSAYGAALNRTTMASASTSGKVIKRRKGPRLTMTKTKGKVHQPRKEAITKILREEAKSDNFILSDLDWSHWKQVIRRKAPLNKDDSWERRHQDHIGYRRNTISFNSNLPAVYEFAVLTPEKQKIPVLASVTMGMKGRHWEGAMLSKPKLRAQVDRVLRRGCKLYARKAPFSARDLPSIYEKSPIDRKTPARRSRVTTEEAVSELRGLMLKVHDYAWRDHYDIESRTYSHRPLKVNGVKLSD